MVICVCTCVGCQTPVHFTTIDKRISELYTLHALFGNDEERQIGVIEADDKYVI
jgi:hypothetical protein